MRPSCSFLPCARRKSIFSAGKGIYLPTVWAWKQFQFSRKVISAFRYSFSGKVQFQFLHFLPEQRFCRFHVFSSRNNSSDSFFLRFPFPGLSQRATKGASGKVPRQKLKKSRHFLGNFCRAKTSQSSKCQDSRHFSTIFCTNFPASFGGLWHTEEGLRDFE